jgi:hypothetical protein
MKKKLNDNCTYKRLKMMKQMREATSEKHAPRSIFTYVYGGSVSLECNRLKNYIIKK